MIFVSVMQLEWNISLAVLLNWKDELLETKIFVAFVEVTSL